MHTSQKKYRVRKPPLISRANPEDPIFNKGTRSKRDKKSQGTISLPIYRITGIAPKVTEFLHMVNVHAWFIYLSYTCRIPGQRTSKILLFFQECHSVPPVNSESLFRSLRIIQVIPQRTPRPESRYTNKWLKAKLYSESLFLLPLRPQPVFDPICDHRHHTCLAHRTGHTLPLSHPRLLLNRSKSYTSLQTACATRPLPRKMIRSTMKLSPDTGIQS